ncbi:MAG: hypothetical protein LIP23_09200, partial [Planctomycetes bacterium]|nr:hypothetical protein [Planctomycetota bacterium]
GAVELPDGFSAAVIHAGLPYETELITMEMEPEDDESLRNRPRFLVAASLKFVNTRQCKYGQPGGMLSELKFRTNENPGLAIRLYSGEKQVAFTTPPGARTARLRFINDTPTPFALLGIIAEASCGQPA